MSAFGKALLVAFLVLPVGAYVAGALTGDQAVPPDRRAPVVLERTFPSAPTAPGSPGIDDVRPEPEDVDELEARAEDLERRADDLEERADDLEDRGDRDDD